MTNKKYLNLTVAEYLEIKEDLYWTLENYVPKARVKALLDDKFDDAIRLYGDTKELYDYFVNLVK